MTPSLPIPEDAEVWKEFVKKTANVTYRGTSLRRLLRNMPSLQEPVSNNHDISKLSDVGTEPEDTPVLEAIESQGLVLDPRLLARSDELEAFLNPPGIIPVIIVLDLGIVLRNRRWGQHAVLLHSIDTTHERKIYVIDPMNIGMSEPSPLDLRRFEIGWRECQNMTILVYPKGYATIASTFEKGNLKITEFLGGSK